MQRGLFPAYRLQEENKTAATDTDSTNQPAWLNFSSFKSADALSIQELHLEKENPRYLSENKKSEEEQNTPENLPSFLSETSVSVVQTHKRQGHDRDEGSSGDSESETDRTGYHGSKQSEHKKQKKEKKKKKHKKHKSKHKKHSHKEDDINNKSYDDYMARHGREGHQSRKRSDEVQLMLRNHSGKVFIEDMSGMSPEQAISIDRKPDPNNITYGGIYKMHIAKRHKMGRSCLGLGVGESFNMGCSKNSREKEAHRERYFSRENVKLLMGSTDHILPVLPENKGFVSRFGPDQPSRTEEFIPVSGPTQDATSVRVPENPLGIYDNSTQLYISGGQIPSSVTSNLKDSQGTPGETDHGISIRKKTAQFNKKLTENPQDIDLWLQFIKFQDEITIAEQPYERSKFDVDTSTPGKLASMDIKQAIMERGIERNPDSLSLKLKQLEICKDLWEPEKLKVAWKNLVFSQSNNPSVWKYYLEFLQTKFSSFTIGSVFKAHVKCLSTLKGVVDGTIKSHSAMPGTKEAMIDIFVRFCCILRSAGHTEKAISLFQAMIELNLFCPELLANESYSDRLEFLETFWDTPVGRLGEKCAQGWAQYVEAKGEVPAVEPWNNQGEDDSVEEEIIQSASDKCEMWTALEHSRSQRHWLAWRPDVESVQDDNDCEDPERLILLDDISPCLFELDNADQKFKLLLSFLHFLGVHCPVVLQNSNELVNEENISNLTVLKNVETLAEISGKEVKYVRIEQFVENVFNQTIPLFDGHLRVVLTKYLLNYKHQIMQEKVEKSSDKKEQKDMKKELKKYVKNFLKEEHNRNELLLWECYALIEHQLGNADEARRFILTALSSNSCGQDTVLDPAGKCVQLKLFSTLVDIEMGSVQNLCTEFQFRHGEHVERNANCLLVLCRACDGDDDSKEVSATRTLKCRNKYQQLHTELIASHQEKRTQYTTDDLLKLRTIGSMLTFITKCYALFQYFTVGKAAASVVYSQTLDKVKPIGFMCTSEDGNIGESILDIPRAYECELYTQCWMLYISMLKYHTENTISPLSALRIPLEQALREMPENLILIHLYTQLESKSNIAGRLRRFFHKTCAQAKSPAPWLCILSAEFRRMQNLKKHQHLGLDFWSTGLTMGDPVETGLSHQIRAWFERASQHQSAKHCVLIWRMYMLFEKGQGSGENSRAVFYRSVQQCPQAKSLYMDYVRYFPNQLQEVCDLLVEKEIRLRLPLEELDILIPDKSINEDPNNKGST